MCSTSEPTIGILEIADASYETRNCQHVSTRVDLKLNFVSTEMNTLLSRKEENPVRDRYSPPDSIARRASSHPRSAK
ncbi:hypothetical protein LIA77_06083 [Sarocladium implicatum]|nr:hypothetical protein LIA77_06083 [Sarocladium implicatum]